MTDYSNRRRRKNVSTGDAKSMSSQLLGLSLFIMLLAFFIVLNAISNYEVEKVRPIMESISMTFSSRITGPQADDHPAMRQDESSSIDEGDTVERLQALFNSQLPGHQSVVNDLRGTMYVKLSFEEFESAVMAVGQRNALDQDKKNAKFLKGFFLPTLLALMKTDGRGTPYRMDVLLNIEENPALLQNDKPQQIEATVKRLSKISEKVVASGLPTKLMSIGIKKGQPDTVEILFQPHVPFNPLGNKRMDDEVEQEQGGEP